MNSDKLICVNTPRCGVNDDQLPSATAPHKWQSKRGNVVNSKVLQLTRFAFEKRHKHAEIMFEHNIPNADIIISKKRDVHRYEKTTTSCSKMSDGTGAIPGHAFFPKPDNTPVEIHTDENENLFLKMDDGRLKTRQTSSAFCCLIYGMRWGYLIPTTSIH
jgi:hypothetical protein